MAKPSPAENNTIASLPLVLDMLRNVGPVFAWDVKVGGVSRLFSESGLGLSRLFDYTVVLHLLNNCGAPGKRLLDVGCGLASFPTFLARRFEQVTVFDVNARAIDYQCDLRRRLRLDNYEVCRPPELTSAYTKRATLPVPDGACDIVTSISVLEHIDDDRFALREMVRVLKPEGRIILMVPYSPVAVEPNIGEEGYFQRFYTKERLVALFDAAGLRVAQAIPYTMVVKPFFSRFVQRRRSGLRLKVPLLNLCVFFPLSLVDIFLVSKDGHLYDRKLLGRFNSPGHYAFTLRRK